MNADDFARNHEDIIFALVLNERRRQEVTYGKGQTHHPDTWIRIITKELGEAAAEIDNDDFGNVVDELVQVAASAIAAIQDISHPGRRPGRQQSRRCRGVDYYLKSTNRFHSDMETG